MVLEGMQRFVLDHWFCVPISALPCSYLFPQFFYRCVEQINKASRGDLSPEELKERQVRISFMSLFTFGF